MADAHRRRCDGRFDPNVLAHRESATPRENCLALAAGDRHILTNCYLYLGTLSAAEGFGGGVERVQQISQFRIFGCARLRLQRMCFAWAR